MNMQTNSKNFIFEPNEYPLDPGTRLIEASAGTGKTFSLAHLVLRLITEKRYSITDMLIISFTNATASEIKSKISTRIVLALRGLEKAAHSNSRALTDEVLNEWLKLKVKSDSNRINWSTLLLKALENIDNADITTIHGFCSKTLRREAVELGNNMNLESLTETGNKQLILEIAYEYWNEHMLDLPENQLKGLQAAGLSIENLINSILKIESDPSLKFYIDNNRVNDSKPLSEQLNNWVRESWNSFILYWKSDGQKLEEKIKQKAITWKAMGINNTRPFSPRPKRNRVKEVSNWIEEYNFKINSLSSTKNTPDFYAIRRNSLLKDYFHPSKISNIEDANGLESSSLVYPELQQSIAELYDLPAELAMQHAISCSLKRLEQRKILLGLVSYSDQLKSLDPINFELSKKSSRVIQEKLREKYKVVMVDEFQDTDPVQWRILSEAFSNSPKHFLLVIGDPKQSIYKFRGGDLSTYLKAKNQVSRIDSLRTNYRATPSLMNCLNNLMKPGLRKSGLEVPPLTSISKDETYVAHKTHSPIEIINFKIKSPQGISSNRVLPTQSQVEESIPTLVTNTILELLQDCDSETKLDDICVLVNRHDQAEKIRRNLATANLQSRLVSQGDILQSQASYVLQTFLDCLSKPTDSSKIRLLACSPLLQWDINKLRDSSQNGQLDQLVLRCFDLAEKLPVRGIVSCLSELLESKNIANLSEQGRLLGDIQQCAEIVQEIIQLQDLSAKGAAKWLRHQRQNPTDPTPDDRRPNSDITENAINLVTIHRSKGLQYKIVICPYLWQSPPLPKGPLWKFKESNTWNVLFSTGWGINREFIRSSVNEALEESERLTYVALTRAEEKLIVIWSLADNQQNNPLIHLLFGNKIIKDNQKDFSTEAIKSWLNTKNSNIKIKEIEAPLQSNGFWAPPKINIPLRLGPTPNRILDKSWGRYSYSKWISSTRHQSELLLNPEFLEEGKDTEQLNLIQPGVPYQGDKAEPIFNQYSNNPLATFPRGPVAGDCLHRILEKLNFEVPLTDLNSLHLIRRELSRSGIDTKFIVNVQEGFKRLLTVPLGREFDNMRLNQLAENRRIHELQFDLSLSKNSNSIQSIDLFNAFQQNPEYRFGLNYPDLLKELDISSKGILTGSIDLVFVDKNSSTNGRWWVADWKSNWIGSPSKNEDLVDCGPINYLDKSMEEQMIMHHYPLQAHLYLVALHKYLKWRLKDYVPSKHLGGYVYIFLRGIPSSKELKLNQSEEKTPGLMIEKAPIERILELDKLFRGGA